MNQFISSPASLALAVKEPFIPDFLPPLGVSLQCGQILDGQLLPGPDGTPSSNMHHCGAGVHRVPSIAYAVMGHDGENWVNSWQNITCDSLGVINPFV